MKKIVTPLLLALALSACEPSTPDTNTSTLNTSGKVIISNEGNYTSGNTSLSLYSPSEKTVLNQAFFTVNNFPIGDVLQSLSIVDNKLLLMVNNSGKILVSNAQSLAYIGTIKGLTSPRYALSVGGDKIYISDLYSSSIAIADLGSYTVTGSIKVGMSTEQMVLRGGYVYVCSWRSGKKVYKIDIEKQIVVDSLFVGNQPNSMVLDNRGKLWVLSEGDYTPRGEKLNGGALVKIDLSNFTVQTSLPFTDIAASPSELSINGAGDQLYYIKSSWGAVVSGGGVYRMSVDDSSLPEQPLIAEKGRVFYALGVNPKNEEIYISDAVDYAQRGMIYRYDNLGGLLDSFKADITPGAFCFVP